MGIFLAKLWEFLGIKGSLIIILCAVIAGLSFDISLKEKKINDLNKTIGEQTAQLETANSIYESTTTNLAQVKKTNDELDFKLKIILKKMKNKPVPLNCPDSLAEIIEVNDGIAQRFNR